MLNNVLLIWSVLSGVEYVRRLWRFWTLFYGIVGIYGAVTWDRFLQSFGLQMICKRLCRAMMEEVLFLPLFVIEGQVYGRLFLSVLMENLA